MALSKVDSNLLSQPMSGRNLVHNGSFQIAQRGTSSTCSGATTTIKTVDRFSAKFFGTEFGGQTDHHTEERSTDAPDGFIYSYKVTTDTATDMTGNNGSWIQHAFEGSHLMSLRKSDGGFKAFTVSFWVKSNKTGNVTVSFESNNNGASYSTYVTINSAATWEYKTVTIPEMDATSLGFEMDIDYTSTSSVANLKFGLASNGSWLVDTDNQWNDAATDRGVLSSQQTNFFSTVNDYVAVAGVQMEVGTTATPFEYVSVDDDLKRCQRYLERIESGTQLVGRIEASSSNWLKGVYYFKVEKGQTGNASISHTDTTSPEMTVEWTSTNFTSAFSNINTPTYTKSSVTLQLVDATFSGVNDGGCGHLSPTGGDLIISCELN